MAFKDLRIKSGHTSQEIAQMLGLKNETYIKYEYSMRLPSAFILTQMITIYQCTADELIETYNFHKEVQLKRYGKTNP